MYISVKVNNKGLKTHGQTGLIHVSENEADSVRCNLEYKLAPRTLYIVRLIGGTTIRCKASNLTMTK